MKFTTTPAGVPYLECWKTVMNRLAREKDNDYTILIEENTPLGENVVLTRVRFLHIDQQQQHFWIRGFHFPVATSTAFDAAKDKFACYLLLKNSCSCFQQQDTAVSLLTHHLIPNSKLNTGGTVSSLLTATSLFSSDPYNGDVVLKPTDGKGGARVCRCRSVGELEAAQIDLELTGGRSVVMTPFVRSTCEIRVVFQKRKDGVFWFALLRKSQLTLRGLRGKTPREAIAANRDIIRPGSEVEAIISDLEGFVDGGEGVFEAIDEVTLWKYNQNYGAHIQRIRPEEWGEEGAVLTSVTKEVAGCLMLPFGCVDFLHDAQSGRYTLLEVNTQILTDLFDFCSEDEIFDIAVVALDTAERHIRGVAQYVSSAASKSSSLSVPLEHGMLLPSRSSTSSSVRESSPWVVRVRNRKAILDFAVSSGCYCREADAVNDFVIGSYKEDYGHLLTVRRRSVPAVGMLNFVQDYGVNLSGMVEACHYKSYTSYLLAKAGVPCVRHVLIPRIKSSNKSGGPSRPSVTGAMQLLRDEFNVVADPKSGALSRRIVVKTETGSGGVDCFLVNNTLELQRSVMALSRRECNASVFLGGAVAEYRVVMLCGELILLTKKAMPYVVGDGVHSLRDLIQNSGGSHARVADQLAGGYLQDRLGKVVPEGEHVSLSWQFNLQGGAVPNVETDKGVIDRVVQMARRSADAIGLLYCAVDILRFDADNNNVDGEFVVMEINSAPGFHELIAHIAAGDASHVGGGSTSVSPLVLRSLAHVVSASLSGAAATS
eukprot:PhM_4_TR8737/c0_g1_i1/m.82526